jgi:hypothetical protein
LTSTFSGMSIIELSNVFLPNFQWFSLIYHIPSSLRFHILNPMIFLQSSFFVWI